MAFTTSAGESPLACSSVGWRSTMIWRCFPPYGQGMAAPGTVAMNRWIGREVEQLLLGKSLPESASCRIGTLEAL